MVLAYALVCTPLTAVKPFLFGSLTTISCVDNSGDIGNDPPFVEGPLDSERILRKIGPDTKKAERWQAPGFIFDPRLVVADAGQNGVPRALNALCRDVSRLPMHI